MPSVRALLSVALLLVVFDAPATRAQTPQKPSQTLTLQVTSRLVFLDVTVLDKKGHPVVSGLTKDDFVITESKRPQPIFSFEAPETHVEDGSGSDENPAGKAPLTILVLDLLNSRFQDFAYIRYEVRRFLAAQPARLSSPAELMVLGNQSLEMVQGYTRSKEDLLYALDHIPAALPYKQMNPSFYPERFGQSIDALQQMALQNEGVPGRKNIVWVGHGGPSIFTGALTGPIVDDLNQYVRDTTNMLVNARMSLFVIYPGLRVRGAGFSMSEMSAEADIGDEDDPFSGDINFGVFVNETGGTLFYNRNDVDHEIQRSETLGSEYYTLTYQPHEGDANGRFRRIRVTLREPGLRAVTKAGYFAPEKNAQADPRQQTMVNLAEAAQSTIAFPALTLTIGNVLRHPDSRTIEFSVYLKPNNIAWEPADSGRSTTTVKLAAASLDADRGILASRLETLTLTAGTQDPARLAKLSMRLPVKLRYPRKTRAVRVVLQAAESPRIGAVELDRKAIDAAPEAPTPEPALVTRPAAQGDPTAPLR